MDQTVDVRTWVSVQQVPHELPEELARDVLRHTTLEQIDGQGYEPAPGAEVEIERDGPAPYEQTVWGKDPDTGEWIGHPDDYQLISRIRAVPKRG
jgi:hypothetical protein